MTPIDQPAHALPLPLAGVPVPRHSAPEEAPLTPVAGPRHRASAGEVSRLRIAAPEERARRGRHAAPEDDGPHADGEDPLAWLGFRFDPV